MHEGRSLETQKMEKQAEDGHVCNAGFVEVKGTNGGLLKKIIREGTGTGDETPIKV